MKLNIANPNTGAMKIVEVDDEKKLVQLYEKRMAQEVEGDFLGDDFKGYVFRISGGNDKQGFPMAQGIMSNTRVRLLMAKGAIHYRPRRAGERKRKSVRGCIVGQDLATLNLVIAKRGPADIEGLTNAASERPRRLGPKRANKIRKLFRLSKEDDVRKFVVTRNFNSRKGEKKARQKRPAIQRLVTPLTLQHKKQRMAAKRESQERQVKDKAAYKAVLSQRSKEAKEARLSAKAKRASSRRSSKKE